MIAARADADSPRESATAVCGRLCVAVMIFCAVALMTAASADAASFGIAKFTMEATERTVEEFTPPDSYGFVNKPYREPFTQAGAHPWALTTTIEPTDEEVPCPSCDGGPVPVPSHDLKDLVVNLPPGLLGDPMAAPRCSLTFVTSSSEECPADTQIGVYAIEQLGGKELLAPIVNVTPEKGQSAEFALENTTKLITPLLTGHLVRTKETVEGVEREGYGFRVASNEIPITGITHAETTFWGVPADASHDSMRGRICRRIALSEPLECEGGNQSAGLAQVPFLTMQTDCSAGPETATLLADSWEEPGHVSVDGKYEGYVEKTATFAGATGCNLLQFKPGTGVEVRPETTTADEPVGLEVRLHVPLDEEPGTNATPQLRDTTVTLPEGMSVSPGIVDGIQACNAYGSEGINITGPESEEVGPSGELQLAPGHCPEASTVGTAEAITPLLPVPVKGHVYLARPGCGGAEQSPCTEQDALNGNLYKLYLELGGTGEDAETGVEFKVPFETQANPATGQLTATASELVQAPYTEVRIKLNGGPRAALDNPAVCGPAVTAADFTPWSAPGITPAGLSMPGTPNLTSSSSFQVEGCSNPTPFKPGFVAGTVTPRAGQFSSFTMNLSRQDREQYVKGIQLHTPPGLLATLSSVPLCGEAQADAGSCPEASKIGTTRVASGAGSHPFEIEGSVYLTGPYAGAPFGLSVVTHVVAGPFNLGLVVVRARIDIDPANSTATITTDESGPYALPQIVFGVPVRLQRVTVNIDRPGFMFNPTDCAAMHITATISGNQNATDEVSSPFAAAGCKGLAFKPKFTVTTSAHTSRVNGASLDAKLSFPSGSFGADANTAFAKVSLPKQLPSRLTTLQKACPAATFASNPALCPAGSIVGIARADTPLLPPLGRRTACSAKKPCPKEPPTSVIGPVYFVSHGGEQFPQLVAVLQGDGVRVDLTGDTFISKAGITSSTFKAVPDVPVGSFELYLPEGRGSALAANGDLCNERQKLKMPTEFRAQNGAVAKQETQIGVSGCATSKAKKKAKK